LESSGTDTFVPQAAIIEAQLQPKEQTMKIGFVTVFVTDFDKSLDFYTKTLGMEIDYTDKAYWAQFKSGKDVSLAIQKCALTMRSKDREWSADLWA
jgi:catechol-2,3-dioxygenase